MLKNFIITAPHFKYHGCKSVAENIFPDFKIVNFKSHYFYDKNYVLLILENNSIGCYITRATLEWWPTLSKLVNPPFGDTTNLKIIKLPNKIPPYLEKVFLEFPCWSKHDTSEWKINQKRLAIELDPNILGEDISCPIEQYIRLNTIVKCLNCKGGFDPRDNTTTSCCFHPEKINQITFKFDCCGKNSPETGCVSGFHIS